MASASSPIGDAFKRSRHKRLLTAETFLTFRDFGLTRPPAQGGGRGQSPRGGLLRRLATDFRQAEKELADDSQKGASQSGAKRKDFSTAPLCAQRRRAGGTNTEAGKKANRLRKREEPSPATEKTRFPFGDARNSSPPTLRRCRAFGIERRQCPAAEIGGAPCRAKSIGEGIDEPCDFARASGRASVHEERAKPPPLKLAGACEGESERASNNCFCAFAFIFSCIKKAPIC